MTGSTQKSHAAPIRNVISVDVEDYFQVQAFADNVAVSDWAGFDLRVESNTNQLLDLFGAADTKATFFTLGWVAERCPELIKRIVSDGHELASHGYCHRRVDSQTEDEFRDDIRRTKNILEDIGGAEVRGYRAATFSINKSVPWAFDVLEDEGYVYSSSIYPVHHDLYGVPDAPRFAYQPTKSKQFKEIPITTVRMFGQNLPAGGGGYFRLLPYQLSRSAIARVNKADAAPAIFYMHPWEIDPEQPRMTGTTLKTRFRHYFNLEKTQERLTRLLNDFTWGRMDDVFACRNDRTGTLQ